MNQNKKKLPLMSCENCLFSNRELVVHGSNIDDSDILSQL